MTTWTNEELIRINAVDELRISSVRSDGTLRNPVTIWVVRLGGDLYVRSVNGRDSAWFRGVLVRHEGHISAGGVEKDVTFVEEPDSNLNDKIDAAYSAKYHHYAASIIEHINSSGARAAAIKLIPRVS
jgi:hypothetical protein